MSIKVYRFLALVVALSLLAHPFTTGWILLGTYIILNESLLKISEKVGINTINIHTGLTTLFLAGIAFLTDNSEYLFLCLIPIFQAAMEKRTALTGTITGAIAALIITTTIDNWFNLIIFTTLSGFGIITATTINTTRGKADYLHSIATTDALTGLLNRRKFNARLSEEFARAKRHKSPLSLALFDIDFFKKINDTYGHNAGDAVLKELGKLIINNTRICDVAARYGGEEFALILPETPQEKAFELMDRLRCLVETEIFNKTRRPIRATISVGVAQLDFTDTSALDFCERADKALYKAKEGGRNKVEKAKFGVHNLRKAV